jgi:hypothetical protein
LIFALIAVSRVSFGCFSYNVMTISQAAGSCNQVSVTQTSANNVVSVSQGGRGNFANIRQ